MDDLLLPGIVSFVLAIYLFAALRFKALMPILRQRADTAEIAGAHPSQGHRPLRGRGDRLCAVIGCVALGFAAFSLWSTVQGERQAPAREDHRRRSLGALQAWAERSEIKSCRYFEGEEEFGVVEAAVPQVQEIIREIAPALVAGDYRATETRPEGLIGMIVVSAQDASSAGTEPELYLADGYLLFSNIIQGLDTCDRWAVPDHLAARVRAIRHLDSINLTALEKAEREKAAAAQARGLRYVEQTLAGPPLWRLYDDCTIDGAFSTAKAQELVGLEFDWECEVKLVIENALGPEPVVRFGQSRPTPGSSLPAFAQNDPERMGPLEMGKTAWARVTGRISKFDKQLWLQIESFTPFQP